MSTSTCIRGTIPARCGHSDCIESDSVRDGSPAPGAGGGFVGSAQAQYGDGGDDDPEPPTDTDNQSSESVTIEYGNNSTTISPFTGDKNITNVYGFDSISFSSDISLQKSDTARVFLYDGPNGLSLVTVLDSAD